MFTLSEHVCLHLHFPTWKLALAYYTFDEIKYFFIIHMGKTIIRVVQYKNAIFKDRVAVPFSFQLLLLVLE